MISFFLIAFLIFRVDLPKDLDEDNETSIHHDVRRNEVLTLCSRNLFYEGKERKERDMGGKQK